MGTDFLSLLHDPAYWESLGKILPQAVNETVYMVIVSTFLAYVLGVPMGFFWSSPLPIIFCPILGRKNAGYCNQHLPFYPFHHLACGTNPIYCQAGWHLDRNNGSHYPPGFFRSAFVARLVESSLKEISHGVIEAALSMGASPWQIIYKVLLPEAKSPLILGVAITTINIIAYTAMAGAVGGGGLGDLAIQYGYNRFRTDIMMITVFILVIIVQGIQWIGTTLAKRLSHR
jgi:D-methionine transport system permease protein